MNTLNLNQREALQVLLDALHTNPQAAERHPKVKALSEDDKTAVKQELRRLIATDNNPIDMRNTYPNARKVKFGDMEHFLTPELEMRMQTELARYKRYTVGVRESLEQLIQDMQLGRPDSRDFHEFTTPAKPFFSFSQRNSERMHFSTSVLLYTHSGQRIECKTIDISSTGIQLKMPDMLTLPEDKAKVDIVFTGLYDENPELAKSSVIYFVVKQIQQNDEVRLFLNIAPTKENERFKILLREFIAGNKHRYKVNLSNTIEAVRNKMCEQYFTPYFPSLPVFIEAQNNALTARFAMLNNANSDILSYWQDHDMQSQVPFLLSHSRLQYLVNRPHSNLYIYAFNHVKKNHVYFYSAAENELNEHTKHIYLNFAVNKASFKIFKVQLTRMAPEQAYTPLSIPNEGHKNAREHNTPLSARLLSKIKNLRYIAVISDVTPANGADTYPQKPLVKKELALLHAFAHPVVKAKQPLEVMRYKHFDVRKESRYALRTLAEVTIGDETYEAISEDISSTGIRIELSRPLQQHSTDQVTVNLPKLQSLTKQFDLSQIHYNIIQVHGNRHIMHLRLQDATETSVSKLFFKELIEKNARRLKASVLHESIPGLNHALRCIYAKNAPNIAFFINQTRANYAPDLSIYNHGDGRLKALLEMFTDEGYFNLEFLYRDRNSSSPLIEQCMSTFRLESHSHTYELFVAVDPKQSNFNDTFKPRFSSDFKDVHQTRQFITKARQQGEFVAIKLYLQQTFEPDLDTLKTELDYIHANSKHHADNLKNQLKAIIGFGYIIDITEEIYQRLNIDSTDMTTHSPVQPAAPKLVSSS